MLAHRNYLKSKKAFGSIARYVFMIFCLSFSIVIASSHVHVP
jgi:Gpi18-like mannosyltransferase